MSSLDAAILGWLNGFAGKNPVFDRLVVLVAFNDLFKGVILAAIAAACWAARPQDPAREARRARLLAAFAAVFVALALNRALASALPHRLRPVNDPASGFRAPVGGAGQPFNDLNAFPSDHAVLFLGLGAGILAVSRPAGIAALAHGVILALLPRLYLGLHHPSDLLAGGALGIGIVVLAQRRSLVDRTALPFLRRAGRHPAGLHALLFVALYATATLFDPFVRMIGALRRLFTGP